jgi:CRP/FNR family transcriptional regulator, anaerobic regulatory protein
MLNQNIHAVERNLVQFAGQGRRNENFASTTQLNSEDVAHLANGRCFQRKLEPGTVLLDQGARSENVYVLLEGWAFCYKVLEDGRRQILDLVMPGSIIGFNQSEYAHCGVEAKTSCRVAVFNRQSFNDTLLQSPVLCLKCANLFAHAEGRALERLSRVGRVSAVERVSGLVVELALRLHAVGDKGKGALKLLLTQCEIADMLGLAKETVCRALMQLRKGGLISLSGGVLEIRDFERLMELVGDDAQGVFEECYGGPGVATLDVAA